MADSDGRRPIRRALVSVYDKTGLDDLVRALAAAGVEIVSTGSTAARIAATGAPVTPVEELTGFPECLDGRVKTLHPKVHAGLLADLRQPSHVSQLDDLGVAPFDLLVSNLYPFTETVASGATPDECVEQIDIGGPAMVRAAAKNFASVAVVTAPSGYRAVVDALAAGGFTLDERRALAAQAFMAIADYDVAVANWFAVQADPADGWPDFAGLGLRKRAVLRYGENPHQAAALYADPVVAPGLAQAEQLHGKEMSYNNYVDADAAWRTVARLRRTGGRHHQAREPVRRRGRRRSRRRPPQGARLRPGLGVRRRDRGERPGDGGAGQADRRHLHRGGGRTVLCGRCGGRAGGEEEHPAAAGAGVPPAAGRVAAGLRRRAGADA